MEEIRVLFKPVGQPWEVRTIQNSWEDLHDLVEGFIEYVKISDHLALVVNDCGVINNMDLNFRWGPHYIFGPAVLVGIEGPETVDCMVGLEYMDLWTVSMFPSFMDSRLEDLQTVLYHEYMEQRRRSE